MTRLKLPREKLHYAYIAPASEKWSDLMAMAKQINAMSYEDLASIKSGINKTGYQQFYQLLSLLSDFTDQRSGQKFGPVDSWSADRALAIDSMSGLNYMAMSMLVGAKPAAHQGEWGVAMNALEKLIMKLTSDLDCFLVMTAHVEKEFDEIAGKMNVMASMLGKKLAPKIPRLFSDVILAKREGGQHFWSTTAAGVDLKTRNLPLSDKLAPSFEQIVKSWRARNELALAAAKPTQGK